MAARLPTFSDILAARQRLGTLACRTPLIEHPALNARVGARVLLKAENLQRVGAFKFRGAYNKVSQVDREAFPGGVVACSSGNHAQGVAAAATLMGLRSAIVMPADSPRIKIERTRAFGAEVVPYDRVKEDRDAIARELCASRRAALVHPFDDIDVIAGQGTAGLEMMEQAEAIGAVPDIVLVGVSGGGLIGGISIAVKEKSPSTVIYSVEPAGFDDLARSLKSGTHERNAALSGSICDALLAVTPGELTFAIARRNLAGGLVGDGRGGQGRRALRLRGTEAGGGAGRRGVAGGHPGGQAAAAGQDRRRRAVGRQHRSGTVRRDHPGSAPRGVRGAA